MPCHEESLTGTAREASGIMADHKFLGPPLLRMPYHTQAVRAWGRAALLWAFVDSTQGARLHDGCTLFMMYARHGNACLRSHSSRTGAVGPWPSRQTQTSGLALHWRLTVRSSVGWASRPLMSPWVTRATSADCRLSEVDQSNLAVSHTHDTVFAQQLVLSLVRIVASRRWGLRVGFFLFLFMIII